MDMGKTAKVLTRTLRAVDAVVVKAPAKGTDPAMTGYLITTGRPAFVLADSATLAGYRLPASMAGITVSRTEFNRLADKYGG
jgi:hypothetical protein